MKNIVFIDSEIGVTDNKIQDLGAVKNDGAFYHSAYIKGFVDFLQGSDFICGHNIIHHDLKYISPYLDKNIKYEAIDTLYLSPLFFPKRPYHALLKDDKIDTNELNNPVNDSKKAKILFDDEISRFIELSAEMKRIFYELLKEKEEFSGFFKYIGYPQKDSDKKSMIIQDIFSNNSKIISNLIKKEFFDRICINSDLESIVLNHPVELAYALALINTNDGHSVTPPWLNKNFPEIDNILKILCNTPCKEGCLHCRSKLDVRKGLKDYFGFDSFRTYNGEPLQENAARAAIEGKSLLAIFPTGGGKSITFQLPALMAGSSAHGLTVVISPLQSLMKDQVDNLNNQGITEAVTINGLLSPVERSEAYRRIIDGSATLLYISPETLRSKTIEKILSSRNIVRFVIDEAHCFSAWGQDFRVDYLYIGDFIRNLQHIKKQKDPIPVSCFTATAKQKVITDICDYFKRKLDLNLEIYASTASRENLHYVVLYKETDEEKYNSVRNLIEQKNCPTIVYVSRTKRTKEIAEKLTADGFKALPFNGKMEPKEKIDNQEAFINDEVKIIVATSAFGMGVDKKDVKLVIHYDISDSLENYIQEAGRAGRDPSLDAECYILFNNNDLDKHFILLNQTKLSISEIQQVWQAIKKMTKQNNQICSSALEIARMAGWDDTVSEIETRVKTAISALETAGYIKRGKNVPHVYATSIMCNNMVEARNRIEKSILFEEDEKQNANRIIKALISSRSRADAGNEEAESRVDYLADILGIEKRNVITLIDKMREDGILANDMDMSASIYKNDNVNKISFVLEKFAKLERFLLEKMDDEICEFHLKELNEEAQNNGITRSSIKNINTILFFLTIKEYIKKEDHKANSYVKVTPLMGKDKLISKFEKRIKICSFIIRDLFSEAKFTVESENSLEKHISFSLVGLHKKYKSAYPKDSCSLQEVEDALLYLNKIEAMKLEGGFLVLYNSMEIKRLVTDNKIRYKQDDYKMLNEFYKQKIQQIHIVGEFANMMVRNYNDALIFVNDYFQMDFRKFINKYFKGERANEINRNITPQKYAKLFGELSDAQNEIINDDDSKYIAVVAGPGSGKTKVLVHKLASLLLLEDVKHEQLLMLTFSRAAATEFKKRLIDLIGNASNFVEIKTFHSYCFDLLGKIGNLDKVNDVVGEAAQMIRNGEVEPSKISKSVLVIDEAQDMDENEFNLVKALMYANDDMRVIAVGDDDQNIYEFRGSDSKYLHSLVTEYGAKQYELDDNYRSKANIVRLSNEFVKSLSNRMKSNDIIPVCEKDGIVRITKHSSKNLEEVLVQELLDTRTEGTSCVLTSTNDEALRVLGLLLKKGVNAKLIQSMGEFQLINLTEVRFFLKTVDNLSKGPVISKSDWEKATEIFMEKYEESSCFENMFNMLLDFSKVFPSMYRSDLEEFIKESKYEDFYDDKNGSIYVSTIHKSKGREFENVYMMLHNLKAIKDEDRRKLYVAMTRAKYNLYIHYDNDLFDKIKVDGVDMVYDSHNYPEPREIALQLTHKDVFLDSFKGRKRLIFRLHSGSELYIENGNILGEIDGKKVVLGRLSHSCIQRLEELKTQGYRPYKSEVRFIVAWKGEDDEKESAIILPNIYLNKE